MNKFIIFLSVLLLVSCSTVHRKSGKEEEKMMKFVCRTTYISDQSKITAYRPAHVAYLQTLAEKGKVLLSGPSDSGAGGTTVYEVTSREELEQIMKEDPFVKENIISKIDVFPWDIKIKNLKSLQDEAGVNQMRFISTRIITDEIKPLVHFYEAVFNTTAKWLNDEFAEINAGNMTLAIGSKKTLAFFDGETAIPKSNKTAIFEFLVENVDQDFERIKSLKAEIVQEPKTLPWGNRSLLFRDLDGNLLNFFTPVTPEAIQRFK